MALSREGRVEALAGAVLDGAYIDWSAAAAGEAAQDRPLIAHLQLVAAIAEVHRLHEAEVGPPGTWGHLQLREPIGRGAFGQVYRARDPRLDRDVALKLLPADASAAASAVIEEGRLLARVRHPNVVTIYGADCRDGRTGLWMELIEGPTLAELVRQRGPLPVRDVVQIGIELARAVAAVHEAGLLHRDIKAQNVIRAADGRIVLMDFGTGHDRRHETQAVLAGTPLYLAPELLAGGEATVKSDVYSLGVLLYFLLTGSYPIRAARLDELRRAHAEGEQPRPVTRPGVPPRLAQAIDRAVAREPHQRYRRAEDVARALGAVAAQVTEPAVDGALTGLRLNALQIGPLIGGGGAGQFYRARDTELHRDVAVRVLPHEVVLDADRLERLARDVRVLASLKHPNIAEIHGVEHTDDATALVMELVEGETLAGRITRGPLAVDEALPIARQIAVALEAAHKQGVIHSDLEPAKIRLRADGMVKVLDFGLSQAIHHATDPADDRTSSAILSTLPGVVPGTAACMAPEQATQQPVTRRVDMWAFGCILFEMLSARPAFTGESSSDVLLAIIEREPDWDLLPADTPAAIHRLLHRCLVKDASRRLDSAAAARLEIDEAATAPAVVPARHSGPARRSISTPLAWASTGALVALLVAMIVARPAQPSDQSGLLQVTPMTVEQLNIVQPGIHFAVAPNGRSVIYSGDFGGTGILVRRDLDRIDPEPLAGTVNGSDVFFSEDGRHIGYEARGELWTTSLDGGTPHLLVPNHPLRGGAWGEDGRIVVGLVGSGLWMTSPSVGEPRQLTVPRQGERHELPQILSGGGAVLFTILSISKPSRAAVYILDTCETRDLFEGTGARFVGSGHLVFGLQGKLWAVGFDPASLQTRGAARPVRDDVAWSVAGYPQFAMGGELLAYVRTSQASASIGKKVPTWVTRQGEPERLLLQPDNYHLPRLSPAGDRLLVQVGATRDLWIYHFARATFTRLPSDRVIAYSAPAWTPDGSRVLFTTWFDGEVGLGWVPADGSGPVQPLVKGLGMRSFESTHPVMLPDNSGVILTGLAPGASTEDLLIARLTGETRLETLLQAPGHERYPAIAPNGRFIAYHSDESGRPEVYVRPFPGVDARRWQISTEGGAFPAWTRDGKEIVYQDGRGRIMAAVRVDGIDGVEFSRPEPLFSFGPGMENGFYRAFDVTSDGERFLFLDADAVPGSASAVQLILIQNWTEELKRLVPPEP